MTSTPGKLGLATTQQDEFSSGKECLETSNVEFERNQLLADIPNPDAGLSDEEKKAIDKKLMWKVDLRLVPWLSFLYLLSFLDRANIGNARLAGMEEDLNMSGESLSCLHLSVFTSRL
jgi:hypothetical protein